MFNLRCVDKMVSNVLLQFPSLLSPVPIVPGGEEPWACHICPLTMLEPSCSSLGGGGWVGCTQEWDSTRGETLLVRNLNLVFSKTFHYQTEELTKFSLLPSKRSQQYAQDVGLSSPSVLPLCSLQAPLDCHEVSGPFTTPLFHHVEHLIHPAYRSALWGASQLQQGGHSKIQPDSKASVTLGLVRLANYKFISVVCVLSIYTAYTRNRSSRGMAWLGGGGGSRPPAAGGGRMGEGWKGRHSAIYKRLI